MPISIVKTVIQIIILLLFIFFTYLIKYRSFKGFFKYIGFNKFNVKVSLNYSLMLTITSLILLTGPFILISEIPINNDSTLYLAKIVNIFKSYNMLTLITILILKSIFFNEVFFRGFLGKQLIHRLGFNLGNLLQAILYGLIISIPFFDLGLLNSISIITVNVIIGYLLGHLVENISNGSICPSCIVHIIVNLVFAFFVILII